MNKKLVFKVFLLVFLAASFYFAADTKTALAGMEQTYTHSADGTVSINSVAPSPASSVISVSGVVTAGTGTYSVRYYGFAGGGTVNGPSIDDMTAAGYSIDGGSRV